MTEPTIILLARFAAATAIACVGIWRVHDPFTALLIVCAAAFVAVGHC